MGLRVSRATPRSHAIYGSAMLSPSHHPDTNVSIFYPGFMWWELLMLWRQLYLVGFALLVRPGTVEQLVISFLIALSMMLLFAVAAPFKDDGDDYFAQVCAIALYMQHLRLHTP